MRGLSKAKVNKTKLMKDKICDGCRMVITKGDTALSRHTNFRGNICKVYFHSRICETIYEEKKAKSSSGE